MKCIHCQRDSKLRERTGGCCPQCHRKFAFEPQEGDPLTDAAFAAAIERVSSGGSVRFLADHLYYEVRRRLRRGLMKSLRTLGIIAAVAIILAVLLLRDGWF